MTARSGGAASARVRFRAELIRTSRGGGGHLVAVPDHVVAALGGKGRIPVKATFNGVPYRGSIVRMGGTSALGVLKGIISQLGADVGDQLDVVVELDIEERTIDPPPDLASVLRRDQAARAAWDRLSYTHRREFVMAIEAAKKPETRARRIDKTLQELRAKRP